ncbi:MAG: hypothetical protein ACE361_16770 [Aureliella sp.]
MKLQLRSVFALVTLFAILISTLPRYYHFPLKLRRLSKELDQGSLLHASEITNMCSNNGLRFILMNVGDNSLHYGYKESDCVYLLSLSFGGPLADKMNPQIADASIKRIRISQRRRTDLKIWELANKSIDGTNLRAWNRSK